MHRIISLLWPPLYNLILRYICLRPGKQISIFAVNIHRQSTKRLMRVTAWNVHATKPDDMKVMVYPIGVRL